MTFDNFRKVEKCYKSLSKGKYDRVEVEKVYKLLPQEFKVSKSTKNERVAAIKAYYEHVFIPAIQKILGNGYSGQTG